MWSWALVAFGAFQAASLVLAPEVRNSSVWQPTYPAFLGGPIMAALTVVVARPLLGSRLGRLLTAATALLWIAGQLSTDMLVYFAEGAFGPRGNVWSSAAGPLTAAMNGLVLLTCFQGVVTFSHDPVAIPLQLAAWWALGWVWAARRARLHPGLETFGLALSSAVLLVRVCGWMGFILD